LSFSNPSPLQTTPGSISLSSRQTMSESESIVSPKSQPEISHSSETTANEEEVTENKRNVFIGSENDDEEFDFKRGKLIGKGSFGHVFCALNNKNGEMIAIKQIDLDMMSEENREVTLSQLETEIQLMRELRHINIVSLLGTQIQYSPKVCMNIIMEYVPGNSIETMLTQFGAFSESIIINYTRQLLHALSYCHARGVIHRDIKGKNILLHTSGVLKLADFGSAKMFNDVLLKEAPSSGYAFTPLWIAPEVMTGTYNSRVDIWSLGCVIVEMATAKHPWAENNFDNPFRVMYYISSTDATPAIPSRLSALGKNFVSLCFQRDPDLRPSADELLQHPWLAENSPSSNLSSSNLQ